RCECGKVADRLRSNFCTFCSKEEKLIIYCIECSEPPKKCRHQPESFRRKCKSCEEDEMPLRGKCCTDCGTKTLFELFCVLCPTDTPHAGNPEASGRVKKMSHTSDYEECSVEEPPNTGHRVQGRPVEETPNTGDRVQGRLVEETPNTGDFEEGRPVEETPNTGDRDQRCPVEETPNTGDRVQGRLVEETPNPGDRDQRRPVEETPNTGDFEEGRTVEETPNTGDFEEGRTVEETPNTGDFEEGRPVEETPNTGDRDEGRPVEKTPNRGDRDQRRHVEETPNTGDRDQRRPVEETPNTGDSDQGRPVEETPNTGDSDQGRPVEETPNTGDSDQGRPVEETPNTGDRVQRRLVEETPNTGDFEEGHLVKRRRTQVIEKILENPTDFGFAARDDKTAPHWHNNLRLIKLADHCDAVRAYLAEAPASTSSLEKLISMSLPPTSLEEIQALPDNELSEVSKSVQKIMDELLDKNMPDLALQLVPAYHLVVLAADPRNRQHILKDQKWDESKPNAWFGLASKFQYRFRGSGSEDWSRLKKFQNISIDFNALMELLNRFGSVDSLLNRFCAGVVKQSNLEAFLKAPNVTLDSKLALCFRVCQEMGSSDDERVLGIVESMCFASLNTYLRCLLKLRYSQSTGVEAGSKDEISKFGDLLNQLIKHEVDTFNQQSSISVEYSHEIISMFLQRFDKFMGLLSTAGCRPKNCLIEDTEKGDWNRPRDISLHTAMTLEWPLAQQLLCFLDPKAAEVQLTLNARTALEKCRHDTETLLRDLETEPLSKTVGAIQYLARHKASLKKAASVLRLSSDVDKQIFGAQEWKAAYDNTVKKLKELHALLQKTLCSNIEVAGCKFRSGGEIKLPISKLIPCLLEAIDEWEAKIERLKSEEATWEAAQFLKSLFDREEELVKELSYLATEGDSGDLEQKKIEVLVQVVNDFQEIIYGIEALVSNEERRVTEFLELCRPVMERLQKEPKRIEDLTKTANQLKWIKIIKENQGSVERPTLEKIEEIFKSGSFQIGCLVENTDHFLLTTTKESKADDSPKTQSRAEFTLADVKDLQSKLMLIAGSAYENKLLLDSFVKLTEGILRLVEVYKDFRAHCCLLCEQIDIVLEEVLVCSDQTTEEDVSVFMHRSVLDQNSQALYVIMGAEQLSYQNSVFAEDIFSRLLDLVEGRTKAKIFALMADDQQRNFPFCSILASFIQDYPIIPNEKDIRDWTAKFLREQTPEEKIAGSEIQGFQEFVLKFMLIMSKDFATRSLSISDESGGSQISDGKFTDSPEKEDLQNFQLRRRWEQNSHPYLLFNEDGATFTFVGFTINPAGDLLDQKRAVIQKGIMSQQLYKGLHRQGVHLDEAFDSLPRDEMINKIRMVFGFDNRAASTDPDLSYELTTDNAMKMLAIYMRFRCEIPVVLMGETGCGKTKLVEFLSKLMLPEGHPPLSNIRILKVHGGVSEAEVVSTLREAEKLAAENFSKSKRSPYTIVFFDEVNTTSAVGLIKEVMIDGRAHGKPIDFSKGLRCVAACNPYRKHSEETIKILENSGLGYRVRKEQTSDRFGTVPMRHLVYRVKPLPLSFLQVLWDFGNLTDESERKYIDRIIESRKTAFSEPAASEKELNILKNAIAASQRFMRTSSDEAKFVSLRDVEKAMKMLEWLYRSEIIDTNSKESKKCNLTKFISAAVISLANMSGFKVLLKLLDSQMSEVGILYASSFPKDQEYSKMCTDINKIKVSMERGGTLVLLNIENLYESLYDALNQYYEYCGQDRFVDLGLGTHRLKCKVHKEFRIIVIADQSTVEEKFPIPLINRLEKHKLSTEAILNDEKRYTIRQILEWVQLLLKLKSQIKDLTLNIAEVQRLEDLPDVLFTSFYKHFEKNKTHLNSAENRKLWQAWVTDSDAVICRLLLKNGNEEMQLQWDRIQCVFIFLTEVVNAFDSEAHIEESDIKPIQLWNSLQRKLKENFQSLEAIRIIEEFVDKMNTSLTEKILGSKDCSKCKKRSDFKLILPCADRLCAECVADCEVSENHADSRKCPICKQDFDPKAVSGPKQQVLVDFKARCTRFMMQVVSKLCFQAAKPPTEDLCHHLIGFVTRTSKQNAAFGLFFGDDRDDSPVFRSFILQRLLKFQPSQVESLLQQHVDAVANFRADARHDLAKIIVNCMEDAQIVRSEAEAMNEEQQLHHAVSLLAESTLPEKLQLLQIPHLQNIASRRVALRVLAFVFSLGNLGEETVNALARALEPHKWSRIYFLRCLSMEVGVSAAIGLIFRNTVVKTTLEAEIGGMDVVPVPDFLLSHSEAYKDSKEYVLSTLYDSKTQKLYNQLAYLTQSPLPDHNAALLCIRLAYVLHANSTNESSAFRKFLKDLKSLADNSYLPAMMHDEIWERLLPKRPSCTQGWVKYKCHECAADIGGQKHKIAANNTEYKCKTKMGFSPPSMKEGQQPLRKLTPASAALIRLLQHLAMLVSPDSRRKLQTPDANCYLRGFVDDLKLFSQVTGRNASSRTFQEAWHDRSDECKLQDVYEFGRIWDELKHRLKLARFEDLPYPVVKGEVSACDLPLAALLPHSSEWGRCIVALVQLLVDAQNAVIDASAIKTEKISLDDIDQAAVIPRDLEAGLLPILLANSSYSLKDAACVEYDFKSLECQLVDFLARGRCRIAPLLSPIVYKDEVHLMQLFKRLERTVPQNSAPSSVPLTQALSSNLPHELRDITELLDDSLPAAMRFLISLAPKDTQELLHAFMTERLAMPGLPTPQLQRSTVVKVIELPMELPKELKNRRSILMEKLHAFIRLELSSGPAIYEGMELQEVCDIFPEYDEFSAFDGSFLCEHAVAVWTALNRME
uniref:RING-type domain-containing protein n=1 Tax=Macrostomum lignano TaxID=282301 RepID=A0A1I8J9L4_9PLAT